MTFFSFRLWLIYFFKISRPSLIDYFASLCNFFCIKYSCTTSFKFLFSVNATRIVEFCHSRTCVHHGSSVSMTSQQNDGWSCVLPKHVNWSLVIGKALSFLLDLRNLDWAPKLIFVAHATRLPRALKKKLWRRTFP